MHKSVQPDQDICKQSGHNDLLNQNYPNIFTLYMENIKQTREHKTISDQQTRYEH